MDNPGFYPSTERFSDRAVLYAKYRPAYPAEVLAFFKSNLDLRPAHVIADIGAGTGIFARPFLENGNRVICVEPNKEMREQGQCLLKEYRECLWSDGKAEATMLRDKSVDFINCAQAFHWFDAERAAREFNRIGKSSCITVLIWNSRKNDGSPFMSEYELLMHRHGKDYDAINESKIDEDKIQTFFRGTAQKIFFQNNQPMDVGGLIGRAFSSSYMPQEGTTEFVAAENDLRDLFFRYQANNRVLLEYETRMYYGRI